MRLGCEVHRPTVLSRTAVPRRAVRNALSLVLAVLMTAFLQLAHAHGQAMRTYVSGTGKGGNPCTLANPCRTPQTALGLTGPGSEIQSLNSADYGYVTINQAVTLLGAHGATGVLAANVSGVTITTGANDIVILKGLEIDGGGSGANGIQFNSGAALNVQDSVIRGFATGISSQPKAASSLSVSGTILSNNTTGLLFQTSTASTGILTDAHLVNNASGAVVQGASGASVAALTVQNGVVANNATVGHSIVNVSGTTVANNGTGVQAQRSNATLQLAGLYGDRKWLWLDRVQWWASGLAQGTNNSIGGNIAANSAPPPSPSSSPSPSQFYTAKNIVTDFGARCDGSSDNSAAFAAFNTWAVVQTLPIVLTIPNGATCTFTGYYSPAAVYFSRESKNLR